MDDIIADINKPLAAPGERKGREGSHGESLTAAAPFLHVKGVAHASSTQLADVSTDCSAPSTLRSIGVSELAREVSACIGELRACVIACMRTHMCSMHACMRTHMCVRFAWR